jgi:hypothetical protein
MVTGLGLNKEGSQKSIASARSMQEARFFIQSALNAMCMEVREM